MAKAKKAAKPKPKITIEIIKVGRDTAAFKTVGVSRESLDIQQANAVIKKNDLKQVRKIENSEGTKYFYQ